MAATLCFANYSDIEQGGGLWSFEDQKFVAGSGNAGLYLARAAEVSDIYGGITHLD